MNAEEKAAVERLTSVATDAHAGYGTVALSVNATPCDIAQWVSRHSTDLRTLLALVERQEGIVSRIEDRCISILHDATIRCTPSATCEGIGMRRTAHVVVDIILDARNAAAIAGREQGQ